VSGDSEPLTRSLSPIMINFVYVRESAVTGTPVQLELEGSGSADSDSESLMASAPPASQATNTTRH